MKDLDPGHENTHLDPAYRAKIETAFYDPARLEALGDKAETQRMTIVSEPPEPPARCRHLSADEYRPGTVAICPLCDAEVKCFLHSPLSHERSWFIHKRPSWWHRLIDNPNFPAAVYFSGCAIVAAVAIWLLRMIPEAAP